MRGLVRVRRLLNSLLNLLFFSAVLRSRAPSGACAAACFADPYELSKKIGVLTSPLRGDGACAPRGGPYRD